MDALDELMRLGVPITCVTDIVNSFDLQPFLDRQFNLWRWDETSITERLYNVSTLSSDRKTKHCAKRKVEYLAMDGNEVSIAIRKLYSHRVEAQTQSAQMLKLFDRLFSLSFIALRETVPFVETQLSQPRLTLMECGSILACERNYLEPKTYDDYVTIIDCLKKIFTKGYPLPKHNALADILQKEKYKSLCIVVPERFEKSMYRNTGRCGVAGSGSSRRFMFCTRQSIILYQASQFSATIVVGWLKRAIMRKILYGLILKYIRFCCMTTKNAGRTTIQQSGMQPLTVFKIDRP